MDVAVRSGLSQRTVSRIECGGFESLSCRTVDRIGAALGIRVDLIGSWEGARGDALVDAAHAALDEEITQRLLDGGWKVNGPNGPFGPRRRASRRLVRRVPRVRMTS